MNVKNLNDLTSNNELYIIAFNCDVLDLLDMPKNNLAFNDPKTKKWHISSISILQILVNAWIGNSAQLIFPVLHLSNRRDMIARFLENLSDLALFLPEDNSLIHGGNKRGIYPFAHDIFHLLFRSVLAYKGLVNEYMNIAYALENSIEKIPLNNTVICYEFTFPFPFNNASEEDLVRWLLGEASGWLVDADKTGGIKKENSWEATMKNFMNETLELRNMQIYRNDPELFDFSTINKSDIIEKCWNKIKEENCFRE